MYFLDLGRPAPDVSSVGNRCIDGCCLRGGGTNTVPATPPKPDQYITFALFSSGCAVSWLIIDSRCYFTGGIRTRHRGNPIRNRCFVSSSLTWIRNIAGFHLLNGLADVYEGTPPAVTSYLSVISKGDRLHSCNNILIKVFAPICSTMAEVLSWVIIASITVANLFAIRPAKPERFMAFLGHLAGGLHHAGIDWRRR